MRSRLRLTTRRSPEVGVAGAGFTSKREHLDLSYLLTIEDTVSITHTLIITYTSLASRHYVKETVWFSIAPIVKNNFIIFLSLLIHIDLCSHKRAWYLCDSGTGQDQYKKIVSWRPLPTAPIRAHTVTMRYTLTSTHHARS